jgi:hypothetical protein
MSESFIYSAGLNNVGSFQVSGIPFVTGAINATTATKITFPYVTRWIEVVNFSTTAEVKVGFSQNGVQGTRYFRVARQASGYPVNNSIRLEIKATELWLSGANGVDVVAGLTNIPTGRIDNPANSPSGSNWSGSANV